MSTELILTDHLLTDNLTLFKYFLKQSNVFTLRAIRDVVTADVIRDDRYSEFSIDAYDEIVEDHYRVLRDQMHEKFDYKLRAVLYYLQLILKDEQVEGINGDDDRSIVNQSWFVDQDSDVVFLARHSPEFNIGLVFLLHSFGHNVNKWRFI